MYLSTLLSRLSQEELIEIRKIIDRCLRNNRKSIDLIEDLDLHISVRSRVALKRNNINSLKDLSNMTASDFKILRGVGERTFNEICGLLYGCGRSWKENNKY